MIVTIDPGVRATGVAVWDHHLGRYYLRRAHLVQNKIEALAVSTVAVARDAFVGDYPFEAVVIELPQVYTADKSKGDPNDLIAVAAVAGGILSTYARFNPSAIHFVLPREWKGNTKKFVTKNRVLVDCRPQELGNIVLTKNKKLNENIYDAVGIGLWYLKKNKLRSASPERSMRHLSDKFTT